MEDALDRFVDELLDIALENRRDDARIIIRDRLVKDSPSIVYETCSNAGDPLVRFSFRTTAGAGERK